MAEHLPQKKKKDNMSACEETQLYLNYQSLKFNNHHLASIKALKQLACPIRMDSKVIVQLQIFST